MFRRSLSHDFDDMRTSVYRDWKGIECKDCHVHTIMIAFNGRNEVLERVSGQYWEAFLLLHLLFK